MTNHDENIVNPANPLQAGEPGPQPDQPPPSSGELQTTAGSETLREDLQVPWDWLDLVLFVLIVVGGASLLGILAVMALGLVGVTPAQLYKTPGIRSLVTVVGQILLDLAILGYLAVQMRLRFQSPFWRTIGWRSLKTRTIPPALVYTGLVFLGLALSILVSRADIVFAPKRTLPIQAIYQDQHAAILFMLMAVLLAPLMEETVFRGYLYPVVARGLGVMPGVIVTGIIFGMLHAVQLWGGWWQIFLLIVVGTVLTAVRAITGTVWASYVVHASYNSLQALGYLIVVTAQYFHHAH